MKAKIEQDGKIYEQIIKARAKKGELFLDSTGCVDEWPIDKESDCAYPILRLVGPAPSPVAAPRPSSLPPLEEVCAALDLQVAKHEIRMLKERVESLESKLAPTKPVAVPAPKAAPEPWAGHPPLPVTVTSGGLWVDANGRRSPEWTYEEIIAHRQICALAVNILFRLCADPARWDDVETLAADERTGASYFKWRDARDRIRESNKAAGRA